MLPIILEIRDENDRNYVSDIYYKYGTKLSAIARKYLSNTIDIDDCVQDVIVVLIKRLQEYQMWDEKHQFNFLARCCRCIAVNKYNKNQRKLENEVELNYTDDKDFDIVDDEMLVEQLIISNENVKRIRDMIEDMDPIYGDILYLKSFLGMKNNEIAETLKLSVDVVNMRLMRARRILLAERSKEINEIRRK